MCFFSDLQLLWEEEREELELTEKQSFIDLGCGNGLLVYLLSCEGVGTCMYHVEKRERVCVCVCLTRCNDRH